MKRLFSRALPAVAIAMALSATALASPISGDLSFSGSATLDKGIGLATKATAFNNFAVQNGTGAFSSLVTGTPVATTVSMATPWVFNPSTPLAGLWSVSGFTFDLMSSKIDFQSPAALVVSGVGSISNGPDPSIGTWQFTANLPNTGAAGTYVFSFSAGTSVPDGGTTAMLLGLGLTGLAMLARWRKIA